MVLFTMMDLNWDQFTKEERNTISTHILVINKRDGEYGFTEHITKVYHKTWKKEIETRRLFRNYNLETTIQKIENGNSKTIEPYKDIILEELNNLLVRKQNATRS